MSSASSSVSSEFPRDRDPLSCTPGDFDPVREIRDLRLALADRLRVLQTKSKAETREPEPETAEASSDEPAEKANEEEQAEFTDTAIPDSESLRPETATASISDAFLQRLDEAQRLLAQLQPAKSEACREKSPSAELPLIEYAECACCGGTENDESVVATVAAESLSEFEPILETTNSGLTLFGVVAFLLGILAGFLAPKSGMVSPLILTGLLLAAVGLCGRLLAGLTESPQPTGPA